MCKRIEYVKDSGSYSFDCKGVGNYVFVVGGVDVTLQIPEVTVTGNIRVRCASVGGCAREPGFCVSADNQDINNNM